MEETQKKFSLDSITQSKILKGALIAMGGALCTYLLEIIPGINFGSLTPLVVAMSSLLINAIREYIKGE